MTRRGGPSTGAIKEDSQTMSFDISSVRGPDARMAPQPTGRGTGAEATRRSASSEAVKVDVGTGGIPASPPTEVLDAMGVAAAAHAKLADSGRGLSFKIDDATGKVVVSVHDNQGKVLFTVPASKALDIAAGGTLDQ